MYVSLPLQSFVVLCKSYLILVRWGRLWMLGESKDALKSMNGKLKIHFHVAEYL